MSTAKPKEHEVLARQLAQLSHEAHRDIFNELVQSGIDFYETHGGRDIRLQILREYQIWRDRCINSAESIASSFLKNCKELNVDPMDTVYIFQEAVTKLVDDTSHSLKLSHKTFSVLEPDTYPQYVSEAEKLRPYLNKRMSEIVENAKDGYCQGALIYRHEKPTNWIVQFWRNQWQTILFGLLAAAGGAIVTLIGPTVKTAISSWFRQ